MSLSKLTIFDARRLIAQCSLHRGNPAHPSHTLLFDLLDPPEHIINDVLESLNDDRASRVSRSLNCYAIGHDRVVKRGRYMTEKEARAMQYIRQETTIPVPRVHMSFSRDNVGYIVMDRVEGETLATASFDLTHEQLTAIATELKGYVEQIARLQPPNPTFGSWPSGPYFNNYFHEGKGAVALPSFKEFHAYWVKRLGPRSREVFPTSILDNVCTEDLDVSFMHGDLNLSNIMVKDGKIVSILDWDSLGWYPRFWEMMTIRRGYMSLEWRDVVDSVFGPYPPIVSAYSECLFYICEGM